MTRTRAPISIILFVLLVLLAAAPPVDAGQNEADRIEALLACVEVADVTFVRNGTRHTAREAAAHLRLKWQKAGGRITTAEVFIDKLASRSSLSGQPYFVILHNGLKVESGPWLFGLLKRLHATDGAARNTCS